MKGASPFVAGLLLLLGAAGLLGLTGRGPDAAAAREAGQWLVRQELGIEELLAASPSPDPEISPMNSASPPPATPDGAPVPVKTVSEAWEERSRVEDVPATSVQVEDMSLDLRNATGYDVDFTQLPALRTGLDFSGDPAILIVHTHTTESYLRPGESPQEAVYRSLSEDEGVMAVGDAMGEALEARGYRVLHDKTLCDYPEYNGAYSRSREVIAQDLAAYPSICLVLDVHRDAVADSDGNQLRLAVSSEDGDAAQVMLVVGTDDGGLEHPDWRLNLSLAAVLQGVMNRNCPGLARPVNLRSERFNQDLGPLALLVEVGASGNSLEEALRSAELFSASLAEVLDRYSGKSS